MAAADHRERREVAAGANLGAGVAREEERGHAVQRKAASEHQAREDSLSLSCNHETQADGTQYVAYDVRSKMKKCEKAGADALRGEVG